MPEVSLIVPTMGSRPTLARAMASALAQDFPSFEVVVVDDAPMGAAWRHEAANATWLSDPRVRVIPFHQGRGCAAAKNAGLRAAAGRWVCYLDDDNEYRREKVSAQYALALATGSPLVLCGLEIRAGWRHVRRQVSRDRFTGDERLLVAMPDTNVLFHRREGAPDWDEDLGTVDDACFFQAFMARCGLASVPNVPRILTVYYAHAGPRANRGFDRYYRGQRRLVVRWTPAYGQSARRVHLLRVLVSLCKYESGGWRRLTSRAAHLLRAGGWREWRIIVNAVGVKIPGVRRWMVT